MQKHGVNVIVFSSSACVYGDNGNCKEDDPIVPVNPYGQTKAFIEQILKDQAFANKQFLAISLRYFNPIGAHPSGYIGESPNDIPNNLMPYIQKVAEGKLPHLNVYGTDYDTVDGTGVRDYIHVVDLAQGHISALNKAQSLKGFNVYNLGTGKGTSVLELVTAFEKATNFQLPIVKTDRRPGDAVILKACVDKANRELEWRAKLTIEDMCRDAYKWVVDHAKREAQK